MIKHKPMDSLASPRFSGISTFMRLPHLSDLTDVDFIVGGIPFDTGGSFRVGSRFGPKSIRDASVILKPYNPILDVNIFDYCSGVDYGDVNIVPGFTEKSYALIEEELIPIYNNGIIPIFMGGDHSITLPELRAAAKKYGGLALVQFDAHPDTVDDFFGEKYNHGTFVRRAIEEGLILPEHSIQIGIRGPQYGPEILQETAAMGLETVTAREVREMGLTEVSEKIRQKIADKPVFVTFDIDFLDAAYAPGTGTPEICGFTTWEAQLLVQNALINKHLIGFDLVEVLPSYDHAGITSFAAAGIIHDFISLVALTKKNERK